MNAIFFSFSGSSKLKVRFSTRTSSNSFTDEPEQHQSQNGPLKVPTCPASLHGCDIANEAYSPNSIPSPNSDTALYISKEHSPLPALQQLRLQKSNSDEISIRRSSSNEAISATFLASQHIKKSSSYGQLSDSTEIADANFLANEVAFVSNRLSKVASTCLSNCWRDFEWYQLLLMDSVEDDSSTKKLRKKLEPRKERTQDICVDNWKLANTLSSIRKNIIPVRYQ